MSTIKGPFDFTGSFGNFRCYDDPGTGKRTLSEKGGYTQKQFETLASLEENRKNAREFGGRSKWASVLKLSFSDLRHLMHCRCYDKIMPAGKLILRQDVTSDHGFRGVLMNNDLQALTQIDFNQQFPFRSLIRDSYTISFSADKKTVTLSIPGFIPANDAWWVTKFYAVRLYLEIAQIADMVYSPVNQKYEPIISDMELLSRKVISDWMFNNSLPVDVNLSVSFDEPALSIPGTAVVVAMGVEFSTSVINGEPYVIPHSGSMAIVKYFNQ